MDILYNIYLFIKEIKLFVQIKVCQSAKCYQSAAFIVGLKNFEGTLNIQPRTCPSTHRDNFQHTENRKLNDFDRLFRTQSVIVQIVTCLKVQNLVLNFAFSHRRAN